MTRRRRFDHRQLTRDLYVVASPRSHRRKLLFASTIPVLLLVSVAGFGYLQEHAPAAFLTDAQVEARELRSTLNKVRLELDVELATRSELERQMTSLNEVLKQTREELAFVKSAEKPAGNR